MLQVLKVLVVDDSSMSRKMVCKALHSATHCCHQAADGSIAVEMVQKSMRTEMAGTIVVAVATQCIAMLSLR